MWFLPSQLNLARIARKKSRGSHWRFLRDSDHNRRQMWQRWFLHDGTEDISPSYYLRHGEHSSPLSFGASSSWIIESHSCRSPWRVRAIWSFRRNLHSHFSFCCRRLTQKPTFLTKAPIHIWLNLLLLHMRTCNDGRFAWEQKTSFELITIRIVMT